MALDTTKVSTKNAQCQVIWFNWALSDEVAAESFDNLDVEGLAAANAYDISDHILSCNFTKQKGDPAGTFSVKLDSTLDWKDWIKPGEWILISMTQDGDLLKDASQKQVSNTVKKGDTKIAEFTLASKADIKPTKIRGVCYVERVSVDVSTGNDGEFIANYEITGRDYGVIYQETEIWYNEYLASIGGQLEALKAFMQLEQDFGVTAPITTLLKIIHTLFLSTDSPVLPSIRALVKKFAQDLGLVPQWLMPAQLLSFLSQPATKDSYYGNIPDLLVFSKTTVTIPIQDPLLNIKGNAWQRLKEYSVENLHELFTETDDNGKMHLYFRPIPWSQDTKGYPNLTHIKRFKELADSDASRVDLDSVDLISLNLGEDNHARYNHFLMEISGTDKQSPLPSLVLLKPLTPKGRNFPLQNKPSISRHGFKPMHTKIDALYVGVGLPKNGEASGTTLGQYNEVMVDYWGNFIFFESGTLVIQGMNQTKVGKVLKLGDNFPYNPNSIYYIEGYSDDFTVAPNGTGIWHQNIFVTHGLELVDLDLNGSPSGFSRKERLFSKGSSFVKKGK